MNRVCFEEDDGAGRILTVHDMSLDGKALLQLSTAAHPAPLAGWMADPGDAPGLLMAIFDAAGAVPPVILGRPDLRGGRSFQVRGVLIERVPGGVRYSIGENAETITSPQARALSAYGVALADLPDDDGDAGEEDVNALAALIAAQPRTSLHGLARAILAEYRIQKRGAQS